MTSSSVRHGMLDSVTARATIFVGRETEFGLLRDAVMRVRHEPVSVIIGGEAGVGKTRLVEEFGRFASSGGAEVLIGHCLELGEDGLPFAPFAAALRDLLRRHGPAAFAGYEQEFARLLPELGPVGPEVFSDSTRGYLFDLVGALFDRLAAERQLILIIEDLHWADRSTRELLAYLARSTRAAGVLVVGTYRADELHRGHPLRPFLAELDRLRGVERIELGRLDREATAEIVADLLGGQPAAPLIDSIHARAQGNPFFIEELTACADPSGCHLLPDTLRDLLLTRVDRLPETAQRVLRIAAAGGVRIGHRLLAAAADVSDAALEEALRLAVAAHLVIVDSDGGYEFRHALVREAVHDDLLPGERARLHARYAATIEADPTLVGVGLAPAEIAHHWYAAHDHPRALTAAMHAATVAGQRYAYAEKSRLLERVLELWEQVDDAPVRTGTDHLGLLESALSAAIGAGDYDRALGLAKAALAEVDSAAQPMRAARMLVQRAKLLRTFGKSDGSAQLREAYELIAPVPDDPRRAELLADIAAIMVTIERDEGSRIVKEAALVAGDLQDTAAQVSAAVTMGRLHGRQMSAESGLVEMRRAAAAAQRAGDLPGLVRANVNISDLLFDLGAYAESAEVALGGLADAGRVGIGRTTGVFLLANRGEALVALGQWDEADALFGEAARLDPPGTLELLWLMQRARLRLARGHASADDLVARAVAFLSLPYLGPQQRLPLRELRVAAALSANDAAEAVARAASGLGDPALASEPRYAWPLLAVAARAASVAADGAVPAAAVGALREWVRGLASSVPANHPAELAYAAQVAAELAAPEEANLAWRRAVAAWRHDGQPYPLAVALGRLAEAAAAAGDRALATDVIVEACAIAAALDVAPLRERLTTLSRRLGLRAAVRSATSGPGGRAEVLTAREVEVLRLVAAGHSNRRIGDTLYISPKTASVHVSRIIAKLAVANRIEAAAVAHRLGLLAESATN
ncbi:helix-turn-helix transcriptional regulator [Luedemannella helvata]|uniref:helix-turn-helix transcriptional regulator n=1 Tax=Luedemannella helvata TaxID=349315 RepID=UPI0031D1A425